jgi:hypothetical protein
MEEEKAGKSEEDVADEMNPHVLDVPRGECPLCKRTVDLQKIPFAKEMCCRFCAK